jgi:hypothetical protein
LFPLYVNGEVVDFRLGCEDDDEEETKKRLKLSIELA